MCKANPNRSKATFEAAHAATSPRKAACMSIIAIDVSIFPVPGGVPDWGRGGTQFFKHYLNQDG